MFGIIAIALSILTILAGLFMLAKSRKESLGKMFTVSSYAAIVGGVCLLIGSFIGGSILLCKVRHGHGSCYSQGMKGHCGSAMSSCGMQASCRHGMSCGHHGGMMYGYGNCHMGMMRSCCGGMDHGAMMGCGGMKCHHMMKGCMKHMGSGDEAHKEIEIEINEEGDEGGEMEE